MEIESLVASYIREAWALGREMAKGCGVSFQSNENVPKLIVVIVAQLCNYIK